MSDNYLRLVPTEPHWRPNAGQRRRAEAALREVAPAAGAYASTVLEAVTFVDQGANFEEIRCPCCGSVLPVDWFQEQMNRPTFDDLSVTTPCCGERSSLNDLDYRWPAAFAAFELSARNPNRRGLTADELERVGAALGHPVREIWAHY